MSSTDERLEDEIATWRARLDQALAEATAATQQGEAFLENVEAYRSDADHFKQDGDLVRSFEAVVWAWSWLEIGARIDAIDWAYPEDGWPGDG